MGNGCNYGLRHCLSVQMSLPRGNQGEIISNLQVYSPHSQTSDSFPMERTQGAQDFHQPMSKLSSSTRAGVGHTGQTNPRPALLRLPWRLQVVLVPPTNPLREDTQSLRDLLYLTLASIPAENVLRC